MEPNGRLFQSDGRGHDPGLSETWLSLFLPILLCVFGLCISTPLLVNIGSFVFCALCSNATLPQDNPCFLIPVRPGRDNPYPGLIPDYNGAWPDVADLCWPSTSRSQSRYWTVLSTAQHCWPALITPGDGKCYLSRLARDTSHVISQRSKNALKCLSSYECLRHRHGSVGAIIRLNLFWNLLREIQGRNATDLQQALV